MVDEWCISVAMSENLVRRTFSLHRHPPLFCVELVKAGFVKLIPLCTHKIVADALTKSLPSPAFYRPLPCHDGPNAVCFEVFAFLMRLFFPSNVFFPPHSVLLYIFSNCTKCSINAHVVHWGERYTTHRPLSHERVHKQTA